MSLRAADALITWGYASVCEEALALILADCPGTWAEPEAFYLRGRIADQRGRLTEALADFARAVEQTSDDRVRARCLFYIGRINSARGQLDAGERHLEESIALSRMPHVEIPTAAALLALAWIRKEKGADEAETLQAFRTALEEATRQRDLITAGDAHRQLGFFDWTTSKGREQARLHYSEALRLARRCRALPQVAAIFSEMGYLATEWGQPDRAIRYCMNALKIARVVGDEFVIPGVEVNLGLAQRKCGHGEAALASLRKAIQGFRNTENPGGEAYARYELGRALVESGDTGAAREQLEAAARLCRKHGLSAQLRSIESALTEI